MMKIGGAIMCAAFAAALAGCAAHLEETATRDLEAQCAAMGMQFVKTDAKKTEAIVMSSAQVSGMCVDRTDPRYVAEDMPLEG